MPPSPSSRVLTFMPNACLYYIVYILSVELWKLQILSTFPSSTHLLYFGNSYSHPFEINVSSFTYKGGCIVSWADLGLESRTLSCVLDQTVEF